MLTPAQALNLTLCLLAVALMVQHHRRIAEAIESFRNNFRGGPPSPPHPLPCRDHESGKARSQSNR